MIHFLKTQNPWFEEVADFDKTFEIRENDRKFQVDDILILAELSDPKDPPRHANSTEKAIICRVTKVLKHDEFQGLAENYVAMGIHILGFIMPCNYGAYGGTVDELTLFEHHRTAVKSTQWTSTTRREPEKAEVKV